MSSTPRVSIILVNWNGAEDTVECVQSLKECKYTNIQIIIVDNNSKGNEAELLKEKFGSSIEVLKNKTNLGFAGGVNTGINFALRRGSDYILLINNDTVVEPDFLNYLIEQGEKNKDIGILVPKICYYSASRIIWSAGGYVSKLRSSGFSCGEGKYEEEYNNSKFVTFASGCCLLIKANVLTKVGLFDEKYFLYLEDVDFCYRVNNAGYKILYDGRSKILHKVNVASTKAINVLPLYFITRNRMYFARKFFKGWFLISALYIVLTFTLKSLFWMVKGDINRIEAIRLAFADFLKRRFGAADYFKRLLI